MATLVMMPLISAETWLGAAGWARGSHACSGTRPAFEPAPSSMRASTAPAANRPGCGLAIAKPVGTGDGAAQIDDHEKEGRQTVEAEPGAGPRQAERQGDGGRLAGSVGEMAGHDHEQGGRNGERRAIDQTRR